MQNNILDEAILNKCKNLIKTNWGKFAEIKTIFGALCFCKLLPHNNEEFMLVFSENENGPFNYLTVKFEHVCRVTIFVPQSLEDLKRNSSYE